MVYVEAIMSNSDVIRTDFNGGVADAIGYYIGKTFNVGIDGDKMVYGCGIKVDGIRYNVSTHRYLSDSEHEKNKTLIAARREAFAARRGPCVGDFVIINGEYLRFTHNWDERGLQTTCLKQGDATHHGGFHMHTKGGVSYSGSLDPIIALDALEDTGETRDGEFWMFSTDYATAANGIGFKAACRVYKLK